MNNKWTAKELQSHPDWIYHLSQAEIAEINAALENCAHKKYQDITKTDFPLPTLSQTIQHKFLVQLENGIGALMIKGLDIAQYSIEALYQLYWGLGLYFGTAVSQSPQGELIHEVRDEGYKVGEPKARGTNMNVALEFHNDLADVPGLFCIRDAKIGGENLIVNTVAIHDQMQKECPDLLQELYQPFYHMTHQVDVGQKKPYAYFPIFSNENGNFVCHHMRFLIERGQSKMPDLPRLTEKQRQALNAFAEIAMRPEVVVEFRLQPGEMFFINNFTVLHARNAFEDYEEVDHKRLLLRLWLAVPNSRPLPESYRTFYHEIKAGAVRGGMLVGEY